MTNLASKQSRTGKRTGHCRIGTSGFHYKHWKGIFYPENLSSKQWFAYYASQFDTVELNNTFYRLPPEAYFDAWRAGAPTGFCFAVKFSRYGSHVMKLKNADDTIRRFIERAERLADHLAPILVQLPPKWDVNVERLSDFLAAAPRRQRAQSSRVSGTGRSARYSNGSAGASAGAVTSRLLPGPPER